MSKRVFTQLTVVTVSGLLALTGCASKGGSKKEINTADFSTLSTLTKQDAPGDGTAANQLRIETLKSTALQLGAQGGLAWRSGQINDELDEKAIELRNLFNFTPLILENGILPPVLNEGTNTLNLDNDYTLRLTDKSYTIVSNARFVTAPPTWRDYLITHFKKPEVPNAVLLPKTKQERRVWEENVAIGWEEGVVQADTIYEENLAKLKRDYSGMILYRKLLAMRMVSAPYIAKTDLGVTGDKDHLNIGDKVLRISALPGLNVNSDEWKAFVVEE